MAREHALVVTVEDGVRTGGVGDALGEGDAGRAACATPLRDLGVALDWHPHGTRAEILADLGLTPADIARDILAFLSEVAPAMPASTRSNAAVPSSNPAQPPADAVGRTPVIVDDGGDGHIRDDRPRSRRFPPVGRRASLAGVRAIRAAAASRFWTLALVVAVVLGAERAAAGADRHGRPARRAAAAAGRRLPAVPGRPLHVRAGPAGASRDRGVQPDRRRRVAREPADNRRLGRHRRGDRRHARAVRVSRSTTDDGLGLGLDRRTGTPSLAGAGRAHRLRRTASGC